MTRLSNRQFPMLRIFAEGGPNFYMSYAAAKHWDQRPFRSMLIRGWVRYRSLRGFHITKEGQKAWVEFLNTDIARLDPTRELTEYFDAAAYGLIAGKSKAA